MRNKISRLGSMFMLLMLLSPDSAKYNFQTASGNPIEPEFFKDIILVYCVP